MVNTRYIPVFLEYSDPSTVSRLRVEPRDPGKVGPRYTHSGPEEPLLGAGRTHGALTLALHVSLEYTAAEPMLGCVKLPTFGRSLLERDEPGAVCAPNARAPVAHRLVCDREFPEIVADHLGLNLDAIEDLAVVNTDDGADHFGHNDHVAQVRLHGLGLVHGPAVLLGLAKACDEALGLGFQTAVDASPGASVDELSEFLVVEV